VKTVTTIQSLKNQFELIPCPLTKNPAISKNDKGYRIRVLKGQSCNSINGNQSISMGYFETDETGLVTSSPRGFAKQFNKKVQIRDIAEAFRDQ
jgi:hypothetical protein